VYCILCIVYCICSVLSEQLAVIFNKSVSSGIVPQVGEMEISHQSLKREVRKNQETIVLSLLLQYHPRLWILSSKIKLLTI